MALILAQHLQNPRRFYMRCALLTLGLVREESLGNVTALLPRAAGSPLSPKIDRSASDARGIIQS